MNCEEEEEDTLLSYRWPNEALSGDVIASPGLFGGLRRSAMVWIEIWGLGGSVLSAGQTWELNGANEEIAV